MRLHGDTYWGGGGGGSAGLGAALPGNAFLG